MYFFVATCAKKWRKVLALSERIRTFAEKFIMARQFIITGINVLTRQREQLSRPMTEEEAQLRLEREMANRRYQRYQPHKRLKVERLQAVQLTINFDNQ